MLTSAASQPLQCSLSCKGGVIQAHEYGEAFELTSNNRVDLNVLVDYAWPDFLNHADSFVKEVEVCCSTNCLHAVLSLYHSRIWPDMYDI